MKSVEDVRNRQGNEIPDQLADSVAGQNILVDLRVSELLDTAAKLFDRAFRNPAAMVEEGAQLAQALQQIASGDPTWTPKRNDKRFNDPAWTDNTFYKGMLQGYMAWSQSLQNFAEKAGFEAKETGRVKFLLSQISEAVCTENLNPNVLMMKSAQDSVRTYDAGSLYRPRNRRIFMQRSMRSDAVVIIGVRFQNAAQMLLAEDNEVIQTLTPDRSDQPFGKAILPR